MDNYDTSTTSDDETAERLLEKLRSFVSDELTAEERSLLAILLAPGVAAAYGDDEVSGFAAERWAPAPLPAYLARAVRDGGLRIVVEPDG